MIKQYGFRFSLDAHIFMGLTGMSFKEITLPPGENFLEEMYISEDDSTLVRVSRNYNSDRVEEGLK